MMVGLTKMRELYQMTQAFYLFVVYDDELLVGRRVDIELETLTLENLLHLHCHTDGMFGEFEVKVVAKQCIELKTDQCAFGNDGTMLLLDGEKMLVSLSVGENHSLTAKGTNLRAADIEHVAVTGEIG